jgi:hypothetical protein
VDHVDKRVKKDKYEDAAVLFSTAICEERVNEKECYTQDEQREEKKSAKGKDINTEITAVHVL